MRVITTCVGCLSNAIFVTDNYEDHIHSHGFRRLVERKKRGKLIVTYAIATL